MNADLAALKRFKPFDDKNTVASHMERIKGKMAAVKKVLKKIEEA